MERIKRNKEYIIAPLAALAVLFVIFIIKGVFPFGDGNIAYYDMGAQYIPGYTHTHDFLHGKAPLFFDWYNGASCDFLANYVTYGLNPMNIFLLFVSRDNILQAMSIFLALKLMLSSFTMSFYMKKTYAPSTAVNVALSLMYTYCGFMLQNYVNIFFLDLLILFPLLMLNLKALLNEGKVLGYTIVTFLCFCISSYLSEMTYIFVILYAFGYMVLLSDDKAKSRKAAAQLGVFTAVAFIAAAFMVIPGALRLTESPRAGYSHSLSEMLTIRTGDFDYQKRFMLFGCEAGIAALLAYIIRTVKDKKKPDKHSLFFIYLLVLLIIPIISEGSNLIWHMGSYAHFPYRFGYILAFVSCDIAAHFISTRKSDKLLFKVEKKKLRSVLEYSSIILAATSLIIMIVMSLQMKDSGIEDTETYVLHKYLFISSVASCFILFAFCEKKFRSIMLLSLAVGQALTSSYALIAPTPDDKAFSLSALDLKKNSGIDDKLSRIKPLNMMDTYMNISLLSGVPGLGDWTLNISKDYLEQMKALGYNNNYTYTLDSGGTAFTDALLNIKKTYSRFDDNSPLYSLDHDAKYFHIYDCNYTIPFGILAGKDLTDLDSHDSEDTFSYQNRLYKALSGDSEDLFKVIPYSEIVTSDENEMSNNMIMPYHYSGELKIVKNSALYIYTQSTGDIFAVNINEEPVKMPYEDKEDNNVYPGANLNGCALLGTFDNETLSISVNSKNIETDELIIGVMDIEKLAALCKSLEEAPHAFDVSAGGYELSLKVNDPGGKYVFLPIEYNKNWRAKINGSKAEITPVLGGAFTAIKLGNEDAEIKLKYVPYSFWICVIISAVGFIMFAVLMLLRKKNMDICNVKAFNAVAYVCFWAASIGVLIVIFAAPVIGNIISLF